MQLQVQPTPMTMSSPSGHDAQPGFTLTPQPEQAGAALRGWDIGLPQPL